MWGILLAVAVLVIVLSAVAFTPLREASFIQDDHPIVQLNPIVHRGHPAEIFSTGYWEGVRGRDAQLYRPVTLLSFALERGDDGRVDPARAHLVNVALHAVVALLLGALALRLHAGRLAAAAAALLFAVHPVHLSAIARLVGRAEILAAMFTVLALLCQSLSWRGRNPISRPRAVARLAGPWLAGLSVFLALGSKEAAVATPVLVVLVEMAGHRSVPRLRRLPAILPTVVAAAAYLAARAGAIGSLLGTQNARLADNPLVDLHGMERAATGFALSARYLRLLLFPHPLSADYSGNVIRAERGLLAPLPLLGMSFLLLIAAAAIVLLARRFVRGSREGAEVGGSLAWLVAAWLFLLPYLVIGNLLFLVGVAFAERLVYLPSTGFCLMAGLAISASWHAVGGWTARFAAAGRTVIGLALAAALAVATAHSRTESRHWMNEETLFSAVIRAAPLSPRAHFTLGKIRLEQGRDDEALALFEKTLDLWPHFSAAWYEKGMLLARRARYREAETAFREASRQNPRNPRAALALVELLRRQGRLREAERTLREIVARFPSMPDGYMHLGDLLFETGRYGEAADAYDRAISRGRSELRPRRDEARRRARASEH